MSKTSEAEKALKKFLTPPVLIDENMEDFSNDPVLVARGQQAAEFIAKYGLPESFKTNTKSKKSVKAKGSKPKIKRGTPNA